MSHQRRAERQHVVDHYEAAGDSFQKLVVAGYRAMADAEPERWHRIDGGRSVDEVAADVWAVVEPHLSR